MAETSSKNKALLSGEEEEDESGDEGEELHLELSLQKLNLGPKKKLLILGPGGFLCHRVFRYDRSKFPKRRTCPDASYGSFHGPEKYSQFFPMFSNFLSLNFSVVGSL